MPYGTLSLAAVWIKLPFPLVHWWIEGGVGLRGEEALFVSFVFLKASLNCKLYN